MGRARVARLYSLLIAAVLVFTFALLVAGSAKATYCAPLDAVLSRAHQIASESHTPATAEAELHTFATGEKFLLIWFSDGTGALFGLRGGEYCFGATLEEPNIGLLRKEAHGRPDIVVENLVVGEKS